MAALHTFWHALVDISAHNRDQRARAQCDCGYERTRAIAGRAVVVVERDLKDSERALEGGVRAAIWHGVGAQSHGDATWADGRGGGERCQNSGENEEVDCASGKHYARSEREGAVG